MKEESSLPADDTEHLKMILRPFVLQTLIVGLAWQPTPVFLPGKSRGQRSLIGYSPWDRKELDTTKRLHFLSFRTLL